MILTYSKIFQHCFLHHKIAIMKNKYSVIFVYNHSNLLSHYFHKDSSSPCSLHPVSHLHTFSLMLPTLPRLPLLTRDNSYSDFDSRKTFYLQGYIWNPIFTSQYNYNCRPEPLHKESKWTFKIMQVLGNFLNI